MNKRLFVLLCMIAHNMHLAASFNNNPYDDAYSQYKEQFEEINDDIKIEIYLRELGFTAKKPRIPTSAKCLITPTGSWFIKNENNQFIRYMNALPDHIFETKEFRIMRYCNGVEYKISANGDAFIKKRHSDVWIFIPESLREFIN